MKKCVVIPDSFKGTLDSIQICDLAQTQIREFFPDCQVVSLPVGDGGEGTVDCFLHAMSGRRVTLPVKNPFMEEIESFYGSFGELAVIEMAAAAGLPMVENREDPTRTSTYGVGQLILNAVKQGAKQVILGLGGSCTNDGGCGCAAALGAEFRNKKGEIFIPVGGTLAEVAEIDLSPLKKALAGVEITAMCDIENPMYGENGAAYIYAPQKGADPEMVRLLDHQLRALEKTIRTKLGLQVAQLPGAGAAGGFGAGVTAFLGGQLKSGIETALDIMDFDRLIRGADAVFTGEGKIDGQSLRGKVVIGVSRRAQKQGIPVYAVVGDVGDQADGAYELGVTAIFSINRVAVPFPVARTRSRQDFLSTFGDLMRLIQAVESRR